jgi:hypothetical protein
VLFFGDRTIHSGGMLWGFALTTPTNEKLVALKPAKKTATKMSVSTNAVFFITAPNNTKLFQPKRSICKETLTQKILTIF